jgi:hypothetical protein
VTSHQFNCSLGDYDGYYDTANDGADRILCPAACVDVYDTCLDAFILWSAPFLSSLIFFFFSFVFAFLNPDHKEASPQAFIKMFLVICFLFWIGSSLAAANAGVTSIIMNFVIAGVLTGSALLIGVHGYSSTQKDYALPMMEKFRAKYGGYSNMFKGIFIFSCAPLIIIYWAASFLNQTIRKCRLPTSKRFTEKGESSYMLTAVAPC